MPLIGYARVSTEDQTPLPQSQALKSAGCAEIHEEQASGGNRARPVLARVTGLHQPTWRSADLAVGLIRVHHANTAAPYKGPGF